MSILQNTLLFYNFLQRYKLKNINFSHKLIDMQSKKLFDNFFFDLTILYFFLNK